MLDDSKNIDKLFKDGLDDFDSNSPAGLWDKVEADLNESKKKKRAVFWFSAAASVALILSFSFGFMLNNYLNNEPEIRYVYQENSSNAAQNINKAAVSNIDNNLTAYNDVEDIEKNMQSDDIEAESGHLETNAAIQTADRVLKSESSAKINNAVKQLNNQPVNHFKQKMVMELKQLASITNTNLQINSIDERMVEILEADESIAALFEEEKNYVPLNPSQEELEELYAENDNNYKSNWQVGGEIAPSYAPFNYLENGMARANSYDTKNDASPYADNILAEEEAMEPENDFVFSTGIGVKYNVKKRFGIQSGFYYSNINAYYEHIEVPVLISYKLLDKVFDISAVTGFSAGYLVTQPSEKYFSLNASQISGVDFAVNFGKKISLHVQPSLKFNFPVGDNFFNSRSPFAFSTFVGLIYQI
jgi:hypothetical protein